MDKKLHLIWILLLFLSNVAQATESGTIDAGNYAYFDNGDGTYINLTGLQNFETLNFANDGLNLSINGSWSKYNSTANLGLENISFLSDRLQFKATATSGIMKVIAKMNRASTDYNRYLDSGWVEVQNSGVSNTLSFSNDAWSSHLFLLQPVKAYVFASAIVTPTKIFKCQPSVINGIFSDFVDITAVNLILTSRFGTETYPMSDAGGGTWTYTYGNNNLTHWGNKTVSFQVTTASGTTTEITSNYVFVYSDDCIGTNIINVSVGFGHYTNKLGETNASLINIAVLPFTDYLGAFFYLIVLLIMCLALYLKNANIMTPLLFGMIGIGLIAINLTIADTYKNVITLLMIGIIAAILWKIFKS